LNGASKETTIMNCFTRVTIVLAALLALGAGVRAQSNRDATGSKTTKVGRAYDNRIYQVPPERAGNATRDFPPRPDGAIPYTGTISLHEMSIPDNARKAYNKGVQQFNARDWGKSVLNLQRAIKVFPAFYEAYNVLGGAELGTQNWDAAEAAFRRSIELSGGTFAAPHFGLGLVLSHRKQFVEAEATIRDGLELDSADANGHVCLAWVQYLVGRFPEAERSAREAILYKPTFPEPYLLLAQIHLLQSNPSAEIEDLNGCLKVDPAGPLSARARAALADAKRSLAKENTAAQTKP
jgi:tetratricopeptide (TPR) repeat protein